ncbi:Hsp20/alpha crystallin family protein (plasmid) [Streptomyces sp. P13-3-3]|uniref:Hsp20/alpha crystallin family protein n=1 Tax=Streptomyces sp. P13-3-3 TaxID=3423222 RepID=UPI003D33EE1B
MTQPVRRDRGQISGWAPLREFEELQARMDQLMQTTFPFPARPLSEIGEEPWAPLADVEDTEDAYVMELELPGVRKNDVTVEVTDGELDIHGEVKDKERTGVLRRRTRRIGRFGYRTTLPRNADTEKITADLAHGILTVRVPKVSQATPRRIEISD